MELIVVKNSVYVRVHVRASSHSLGGIGGVEGDCLLLLGQDTEPPTSIWAVHLTHLKG